MNISQKIRNQSKAHLHNNWVSALFALFSLLTCIFLIYTLFCIVVCIGSILKLRDTDVALISIASAAVCFIALSPLHNGFLRFHYNLSETNKAEISNVFYFFKKERYFKTVLFNTITLILILLSTFPIYIAFVILDSLKYYENNPETYQLVISILTIGMIICWIFACLKYMIAHYLYVDNHENKLSYYFKAEKEINKYHFYDSFKLFVSLLLWLASCYFVLPVLYVVPYFSTVFATSAKWLIKLYKDGKIV